MASCLLLPTSSVASNMSCLEAALLRLWGYCPLILWISHAEVCTSFFGFSSAILGILDRLLDIEIIQIWCFSWLIIIGKSVWTPQPQQTVSYCSWHHTLGVSTSSFDDERHSGTAIDGHQLWLIDYKIDEIFEWEPTGAPQTALKTTGEFVGIQRRKRSVDVKRICWIYFSGSEHCGHLSSGGGSFSRWGSGLYTFSMSAHCLYSSLAWRGFGVFLIYDKNRSELFFLKPLKISRSCYWYNFGVILFWKLTLSSTSCRVEI